MIGVLTIVLARRVPTGFVPTEDKGFFVAAIQLPDAASRQRTEAVAAQVERILDRDPAVEGYVELIGLDILSRSNQTNSAVMFIRLKPWGERKAKNLSIENTIARIQGQMFGIKEAFAFAFNFPEIPGVGTQSGLEMNLQNRLGMDIQQFAGIAQQFTQDHERYGHGRRRAQHLALHPLSGGVVQGRGGLQERDQRELGPDADEQHEEGVDNVGCRNRCLVHGPLIR